MSNMTHGVGNVDNGLQAGHSRNLLLSADERVLA